jgi:hypothetical protein
VWIPQKKLFMQLGRYHRKSSCSNHATNQIELKLEEGEVEEESDYKFKNYIEKCA